MAHLNGPKCHQLSTCHNEENGARTGSGGASGASRPYSAVGDPFERAPANGDALAALADALSLGQLDRARPLVLKVIGREPAGRELWELATLPSRDAIRRELEALAREPAP